LQEAEKQADLLRQATLGSISKNGFERSSI